MNSLSKLKYLQLSLFSRPASDRQLYRSIKKNKVASIVEFGVGDLSRSENMIRVAKRFSEGQPVRYTGVDLFEAREDQQNSIKFKDAHQRLKQHNVRMQLVPGELLPALTRIANSHMRTDLIVLSHEYANELCGNGWFYIPRMLHATSQFFLQDKGLESGAFTRLSRLEIERKIPRNPAKVSKAA